MNLYIPQSYEAVAELLLLSSTAALLKSSQNARLLLSITQDALTGGNLFTRGFYYNETVNGKTVRKFNPRNYIDRVLFNDALTCVDDWFISGNRTAVMSKISELEKRKHSSITYEEDTEDYIFRKMDHIKSVLRWQKFTEAEIDDYMYTGHCLFSYLLPDDFEYTFEPSGVEIVRGVMLKGILNKSVLGDSHSSIVHKLEKEYGAKITIDFVSYYQWLINHCLKARGFSIGIEDCLPIRVTDVQNQISKSFMEAQSIETSESDPELRERKVNNALNGATTIGQLITKNEFEYENSLNVMISAGSKGSYVNNSQIRVLVGQQNVEGKRIPLTFGGRTNPTYSKTQGEYPEDATPEQEDMERRLLYESRGFVAHCYMEGLTVQEFFFHAEGGREGVIDTAVKSVTKETTIIIIEDGDAKYVQIGEWIDDLMNGNKNIVHQDEQNMETLELEKETYISTTDNDGNVSWEEISHATRHDPSKNIYKVTTYGGRSVVVAESKSLLVWNKEKRVLEQIYTPDIKVGDYLPVTMNLMNIPIVKNYVDMSKYLPKDKYVYGTEFNVAVSSMENAMTEFHIPRGWWKENNGSTFTVPYTSKAKLQRVITRSNVDNIKDGYIYPFSGCRTDIKIPDSFELNSDNGLFIGLYLAEGNTDGHYVQITNNDDTIREFVKGWFVKHSIEFSENFKINGIEGFTSDVRGRSSVLSQFLDKFVGHGAKNKFVPNEAYTAPKEFIVSLLNGYFSGDGAVERNMIVAGTSSPKLIEGISTLCNTLGIFGKISKVQIKKNNLGTKVIQPSYRLQISNVWSKKFAETIPMIDSVKQEKLNMIKTPKNPHRHFEVHNDIVLDKIVSIEKMSCDGHEKLYDLTIPSTLNFGLANGLQVADTAQSGYIQRKLVKKMEDLVKSYSDGLVVNSKNMVIQFNYGRNFDPARMVRVSDSKMSFTNVKNIANHLNTEVEWDDWVEKQNTRKSVLV
ncbi:MAG: LAGLIDADG family homing endonuclease [Candidatus Colwellbacteria bacterium]|nr:LAGLIDADG family homing endonuclease [Candidatus Colwellbacteria bacterium]